MNNRRQVTIDGNEAAAYSAFAVNEVIAIYPITPSSPMGEWADEWYSAGHKNIWGTTPLVQEMQSEAGVAGAVHGAIQTGALTTTFTCSQGLLLMLPNMYKIAGELSSTVFHVAARSLATQALSIFGDHQDVMAARMTGFAMICSCSVQEVMDFALIAQVATLESRIPFLHFFDGFRTSHEVAKIEQLSMDDIRAMIDENHVLAHRQRRLTPDNPVIRGTAQNPDVHFQARETVNPFYQACPAMVQKAMDKFAKVTGRQYTLFQYYGDPDAQRVVVIMGSGAETCQDTVDYLNSQKQKVGILKVRLYRPFAKELFIEALPKTVKSIAVLDRTKEPGSSEPLYLDVVNALVECGQSRFEHNPKVIGGRYGISSKEFTPAMIKAVFDELAKPQAKNHFTVGINDDVSKTSLDYDENFIIEHNEGVRGIFYGLGADGTVSANKNSIKIIGENTPLFAQGYFVYDSKKSGSMTVSHLRFGPKPIHSSYLVNKANFVACHQSQFLESTDVLKGIQEGGIFLLNTPCAPEQIWERIPRSMAQTIKDKKLRFFVIDAYSVARKSGMGMRINTIMQTCFFAISGVLPKEDAIKAIKDSIKKAYGKKGEDVLKMNYDAVDNTLANLYEVKIPDQVTSRIEIDHRVPASAPEFVRRVTFEMIKGNGEMLPVSAMPCDGTFPVGTTKWEKRNIAQEIPVWDNEICIQCGKCAMVCPHSVIRIKAYDNKYLQGAPSTFKTMEAKDREWAGMKYTIQIAPEDCTGCAVCVDVCPVKNKSETKFKAINMKPQPPLREEEKKNWEFFLNIPEVDRNLVKKNAVRSSQALQPLFEFSGACAGCGETPYVKLATQLFGDRMVVANATGCSSIYGGNLPTTPYTKNNEGRGPTWSNSLFEDNAEFGLGFRLSIDKQKELACEYVKKLESVIGTQLVEEIISAQQKDEPEIFQQRQRVEILKEKLKGQSSADAKVLLSIADMLVKKSVWILGGDGWAYDIGYGGLDHVISSGRNVNILVLDTEVYSNTGGQASKSTSRSAVAKFAAGGKLTPKKDLARMAMTYGYVYVATVSMGAKDEHTLKTFLEAEAFDGPSLIIAYSHCIAHGINMTTALQNQKLAVSTGYWPLFRFNPDLIKEGKNPLILDSSAPKGFLQEFLNIENRFKMLSKTDPEAAKRLAALAQNDVNERWKIYSAMASSPEAAQNTKTSA
ncbi:MAG: pyruvate:ferredoxin (flavodoxin) oxidoreductase [Candidatus Omnitrophica bacterium]|nr:pyruvate:ferredoxin (flavodoxin) oxidoreductase [Candidatus Omnitrophota bacterium]